MAGAKYLAALTRCASMRVPLACLLVLAACGPPPSMIAWHDARDATRGYDVRVVAHGDTLAVTLVQPGLVGMVLYPPAREGEAVVLTAGLVSSGAAGERARCFDVSTLGLGSDWPDHVRWREPDGRTVAIEVARSDAPPACP